MAKTIAPTKTKALTKYDERLAEIAKRSKKAESKVGGEGNFISLRGGHMQYQNIAIPGNKMRAVIICSVNENQFYEGRYDPDNPSAPVCYAFASPDNLDDMGPNPEHEMKSQQADKCAGCPNFEWGSADVGRGKACKEVRRLAIMTEKELEDVPSAVLAFMKVSVTNLKYWAGYVRQLEDVHHKPTFAFITEISIQTDEPGTQPGWHLEFELVQEVPAESLGALIDLYEKVEKTIAFPYPKFEDRPAPARNNKRPAARTPARNPVPAPAMSKRAVETAGGKRKPKYAS